MFYCSVISESYLLSHIITGSLLWFTKFWWERYPVILRGSTLFLGSLLAYSELIVLEIKPGLLYTRMCSSLLTESLSPFLILFIFFPYPQFYFLIETPREAWESRPGGAQELYSHEDETQDSDARHELFHLSHSPCPTFSFKNFSIPFYFPLLTKVPLVLWFVLVVLFQILVAKQCIFKS